MPLACRVVLLRTTAPLSSDTVDADTVIGPLAAALSVDDSSRLGPEGPDPVTETESVAWIVTAPPSPDPAVLLPMRLPPVTVRRPTATVTSPARPPALVLVSTPLPFSIVMTGAETTISPERPPAKLPVSIRLLSRIASSVTRTSIPTRAPSMSSSSRRARSA